MGNLRKATAALKQYFEISKYKNSVLFHVLDDEIINLESLDDVIWEIFSANYTDIEIMEAMESTEKSKTVQQQGIKTAEMIKSYYAKKLDEHSRQATERMTAKRKHLTECLEKVRSGANDSNYLGSK